MQVFLEAIKFNHEPTSATVDAINIRRNETEIVVVPEWRRGVSALPEDSLAVYSIANTQDKKTLTIKAKFKCLDPTITSVEVHALDPSKSSKEPQKNVLGGVASEEISFNENGESEFELFVLPDADIWNRGIDVSVTTWNWQFRESEKTDWIDLATTFHKIYTILSEPTKPWSNQYDPRNTQLPWLEVIDRACAWAKGADEPDKAATLITEAVHNLGNSVVKWDVSPTYTIDNFDCTSFLRLLRDGKGMGQLVNCSDCATIVSTFANAVGCDLWQSQMGDNFTTHPVRLIGATIFEPTDFLVHEVAWKGGCSERDELFDACLKLDSDPDPNQTNEVVAADMKFGGMRDKSYRYFLAPFNKDDDHCKPHPERKTRRTIGLNVATNPDALPPKQESLLVDQPKTILSVERSVWDLFLQPASLDPWSLFRSRFFKLPTLHFGTYSIWSLPDGDPEHLIRLNCYQYKTSELAKERFDQLLSWYEASSFRDAEPIFESTVMRINLRETVVFGWSGGLTFGVRSVGGHDVKVSDFVKLVKEFLKAKEETHSHV